MTYSIFVCAPGFQIKSGIIFRKIFQFESDSNYFLSCILPGSSTKFFDSLIGDRAQYSTLCMCISHRLSFLKLKKKIQIYYFFQTPQNPSLNIKNHVFVSLQI